MKNKRNVLYALVIVITGVVYSPIWVQGKNGTDRADFSGEWKAKESIAMGGNIVCCYNSGDRMLAKIMKIGEQANFLTIDVLSSFPGAKPVAGHEQLAFDGKAGEVDYGQGRGKKFTVKLSADGQTMTVNSIIHLTSPTPYHIDVQRQDVVYVTEVWKLSNDGRSITVQTKAKSDLYSGERSWNTVFDKVIVSKS